MYLHSLSITMLAISLMRTLPASIFDQLIEEGSFDKDYFDNHDNEFFSKQFKIKFKNRKIH